MNFLPKQRQKTSNKNEDIRKKILNEIIGVIIIFIGGITLANYIGIEVESKKIITSCVITVVSKTIDPITKIIKRKLR